MSGFSYLCSEMTDIQQLRKENISQLALKLAGHPDAAFLLRQVEGWQRLSVKVPSWAVVDDLHYFIANAVFNEIMINLRSGKMRI